MKTSFVLASACLALAACSTPVSVGSRDASNDSAPSDGSHADAPAPDADQPDAGTPDATSDAPMGTPCHAMGDCPSGSYCRTPVGSCAATGTCAAYDPNSSCTVMPELVCGCNGHTYNNACEAARAAVSIDHGGPCPPVTDMCISDLDCMDGDFCELVDGACSGTGTCTSRGIGVLCADTCEPVCGCDGMSYQNDCLRRKAAMSLQQPGVCPGGVPPCTMGGACCHDDTECMVGQECVGVMPGPVASGKCLPTMGAPTCWQDIDCGPGLVCMDPFVCPCGMTCPRPDAPGTCS